jgi:hypothetical protein
MERLRDAYTSKWAIPVPSELNLDTCSDPTITREPPPEGSRHKIALHDPISHVVGVFLKLPCFPCIYFVSWLTDASDIPSTLAHETLHCVMTNLEGDETSNQFNNLFTDLDIHTEIFDVREFYDR